jgi:hypothetical protein
MDGNESGDLSQMNLLYNNGQSYDVYNISLVNESTDEAVPNAPQENAEIPQDPQFLSNDQR